MTVILPVLVAPVVCSIHVANDKPNKIENPNTNKFLVEFRSTN